MNSFEFRYYIFVMLAACLYGLITVGGKYFADVGLSLYEISLLMIFTPILLAPLFAVRRDVWISPQDLPFFLLFGLVGALLQLTQFGGIVLGLPVAMVALLLYTQPIWTTFLGRWLLSEKITAIKITAATLAVIGVAILVNPFRVHTGLNTAGVISAVAAGMLLSFWVILGRKSGLNEKHFLTTAFGYTFFSSLWLLVIYPAVRTILTQPCFTRLDFGEYLPLWAPVIAYALFVGVAPNLLAFGGLKRVQASVAGILLLFEPVSAALFAYLIFNQSLSANVWIGGLLIIAGNLVMIAESRKKLFKGNSRPGN